MGGASQLDGGAAATVLQYHLKAAGVVGVVEVRCLRRAGVRRVSNGVVCSPRGWTRASPPPTFPLLPLRWEREGLVAVCDYGAGRDGAGHRLERTLGHHLPNRRCGASCCG